jgi:hypothetical protein
LDEFIKQGHEYREKASPFDRFSRLFVDLNLTHPMSVQRVHELMEWVRSGDYDRIVAGTYPTRDQPSRPTEEAGEAVGHYAKRFKETFKDLGESIGELGEQLNERGQQLSEWLRTRGD